MRRGHECAEVRKTPTSLRNTHTSIIRLPHAAEPRGVPHPRPAPVRVGVRRRRRRKRKKKKTKNTPAHRRDAPPYLGPPRSEDRVFPFLSFAPFRSVHVFNQDARACPAVVRRACPAVVRRALINGIVYAARVVRRVSGSGVGCGGCGYGGDDCSWGAGGGDAVESELSREPRYRRDGDEGGKQGREKVKRRRAARAEAPEARQRVLVLCDGPVGKGVRHTAGRSTDARLRNTSRRRAAHIPARMAGRPRENAGCDARETGTATYNEDEAGIPGAEKPVHAGGVRRSRPKCLAVVVCVEGTPGIPVEGSANGLHDGLLGRSVLQET
ncbi:hypothetical protein C8J57DRAFT_1467818 [Mycena rebaudengoi]|nr:hypothetical protein C8J57DRAFT_1467818 [Mycena rebaudengoi]